MRKTRFDIYNRLTSASGGGTFGYDPASRLSVSSNGATSTYFGYDGVDMVGEYNGSGALLRRYVHGPGSDEPLVWYEGSGTSDRRFLIADELGSIATVADASGAALANNTYTEFGAPGGSNTGRFQYTGQTWLPEAGLYNYKARVYSAALGRFLQTDPIGFEGGLNFYAYVGNDPINFVDPSGTRQTCWVIYRKERIEGTTVIAYDRQETCINTDSVGSRSTNGWAGGGASGGGGPPPSSPQDPPLQCPRGTAAQQIGAFGLGFGDAFTFGLYSKAFNALPFGLGAIYQKEAALSGYGAGFWTGAGVSAGRLTYSSSVSTLRSLPGHQAVAARNSLKGMFSGFFQAHPRNYTYEQMLQKYGSDRAVSAAAARTNPNLNNAAGVGVVSTSAQAANQGGSGC